METTPKKRTIHETSTNTTPSVSKSSCKTEVQRIVFIKLMLLMSVRRRMVLYISK